MSTPNNIDRKLAEEDIAFSANLASEIAGDILESLGERHSWLVENSEVFDKLTTKYCCYPLSRPQLLVPVFADQLLTLLEEKEIATFDFKANLKLPVSVAHHLSVLFYSLDSNVVCNDKHAILPRKIVARGFVDTSTIVPASFVYKSELQIHHLHLLTSPKNLSDFETFVHHDPIAKIMFPILVLQKVH